MTFAWPALVLLLLLIKPSSYSFFHFNTRHRELNMMLGVDFTGSNGNPASPQSLHYRSPVPDGSANQYEQAIMSLGEVCP
jgi:hypothetical protein